MMLTAISLILGYKMRRFNQKGFYVMNYLISVCLLLGAILLSVLYYLSFRDTANTVFGALLGLGLFVVVDKHQDILKLKGKLYDGATFDN
uniref:Uncharacterized protein n=1 Tax=Trichobilharzia regenti TaxID=157069 RepID=A0AA85JAV9_TRIRE|nr:unnamed protein product [Trichobilharzia regenti]